MAEQSGGDRGLAAARLAHHSQDLAAGHGEAHVFHDVHRTPSEIDAQTVHLERPARSCAQPGLRGHVDDR